MPLLHISKPFGMGCPSKRRVRPQSYVQTILSKKCPWAFLYLVCLVRLPSYFVWVPNHFECSCVRAPQLQLQSRYLHHSRPAASNPPAVCVYQIRSVGALRATNQQVIREAFVNPAAAHSHSLFTQHTPDLHMPIFEDPHISRSSRPDSTGKDF